MESSIGTNILLPVALGVIMLGLGVSLTIADFSRVVRYPKALVVGLACLLFNLASLVLGYQVPRLVSLPDKQAIAIAMEIGIHNGSLPSTSLSMYWASVPPRRGLQSHHVCDCGDLRLVGQSA